MALRRNAEARISAGLSAAKRAAAKGAACCHTTEGKTCAVTSSPGRTTAVSKTVVGLL
jgi:hypothetical protein